MKNSITIIMVVSFFVFPSPGDHWAVQADNGFGVYGSEEVIKMVTDSFRLSFSGGRYWTEGVANSPPGSENAAQSSMEFSEKSAP